MEHWAYFHKNRYRAGILGKVFDNADIGDRFTN
jgi:hypothetical protein